MKKIIILILALGLTMLTAGEQFAMSDADRAMYEEMAENNPADIFVDEGGEILEETLDGDEGLAKFLEVSEDDLPTYIAGFPRYMKKLGAVVTLDQVVQALQASQGKKVDALDSENNAELLAYVKSLANDENTTVDVSANDEMKAAYALGKKMYETKRGGRGFACTNCHAQGAAGTILRTQLLPSLAKAGTGITWPAYRMTESKLVTLQQRFQGCMSDAMQAPLPLGSKEMVALELYITTLAKEGNPIIAIPGLKR